MAESPGERRHWRYEHTERDESEGLWYFECVPAEGEWWYIRQIAPHPHGVSAYDWQHLEDERGFLTDQPIDETEPLLELITSEEFEGPWRAAVEQR
jgi:hypothetical protein